LDDIIKNATELKSKVGTDETNLAGWIQDHISQAQNYINQANTGFHKLDGINESVNEGKFNRGDLVRVVDKPKYVSDKQFWGKSGVVTNILNRDILVKFANNRTIVASEKDLILNPTESVINEWKLQLDLGKVNPSEFENWASDSLQKTHKIKVSGSGRNWIIVGKGSDDRMGSSADWITQLLGKAWTINKIKVIQNESVNEIAVSDNEMDKIKFAVQRAGSFMRIGAELKNVGIKYSFSTEPLAIYMIKVGGKYFALVNKKFADKPDFVIGDTAGGMMD
jgi:hypothetical protein